MFHIMLAAAAAAATPSAMTIKDPDLFVRQLTEMGYSPDAVAKKGESVEMVAHLANGGLTIVLGGCTANRDCSYVALVGSFSDVKNPPADWVAKMNVTYDLIKVWKGDNGNLFYSAGSVVEQMPRATFKRWIELVDQSSDDLGLEASKAGLNK
jgi:hypothetical protein